MNADVKNIKIEIIDKIEDFKNFSFITRGFIPFSRVKCDYCLNNRINYPYYHIINKLDKANLLPENFKMVCCDCAYIIEKLGFVKCLDCKNNLEIFADGEKIQIYCYKCEKVHYEKKIPKKIVENKSIFVHI